MKKIGLLLFIVLLLLGGYRFFIDIQFERQVDRFIQNQQAHHLLITADTVTSANSLLTIGRHYKNMQIETSGLTYQNPDVYLFVSVFHPLTVQIRMQGHHRLNGIDMTSDPVHVTVLPTDQTMNAIVKACRTPWFDIDFIRLDLAWQDETVHLQPVWIQMKETSATLTGSLSTAESHLSVSVIGWKQALAFFREERLLSKDIYQSLYWTFQLLSNGNELVIPVTIQNNQITIAGIQWAL